MPAHLRVLLESDHLSELAGLPPARLMLLSRIEVGGICLVLKEKVLLWRRHKARCQGVEVEVGHNFF